MKLTRFLWCSILLLTIHSQAAINEPFQWLNPLPTGNAFVTTAYGNGTYVAFDTSGNIFESTNARDWVVRTNLGTAPVSACYGNSAFVAVGKNGVILSRVNENWTARTASTSALNNVIFVNGTFWDGATNGSFWAVGANGVVLSSHDGTNWLSCQNSGGTLGKNLSSISYGNGILVAVSGNYSFTSTDGCVWVANTNSFGFYSSVAFGNGKFLKCGYTAALGSYPAARSSTNGIDWVIEPTSPGYSPPHIVFGQGRFFLVTDFGSLHSSTGTGSWTNISAPAAVYDVALANNSVIAVGAGGTTGTSADGVNWSFASSPNASCTGIVRGSNALVAVVGDPYNAYGNSVPILTSTNGSPFFPSASAVHAINDVIYTNGSFVIVGFNGVIMKSTDAINWTPRSTGVSATLASITYGGVFVSVGTGGTVLTSSTGDAWTGRFTGITASLNSVTFGAGSYVAVGDGGTIITSTDSVSWSGQYSTVTNNIVGVAYGNGTFVAICDNRKVLKSSDAINWVAQPQPTPALVSRIVYDGYQFICACPSATAITSFDGVNWNTYLFNVTSNFKGICPTSSGLVFCGDNGTIVQSGNLRAPRILSPTFSSPMTFNVQGEINHAYTLQTSTDLSAWTSLFAFTNNNPVTQISDPSSTSAGKRFYRVVSSPSP